jgi:hypothetical protein
LKLSYKLGFKTAIAHLAFYDLSGICIGFTPACWAAVPDKVQVRRCINEIEDILKPFRNENGDDLGIGVLDGGFQDEEALERLHWLVPMTDAAIESTSPEKKEWCSYVQTWIRILRGPGIEPRFADQVHKLRAFSNVWRFDMELHNAIFGVGEGLLNLNRRHARGESLLLSWKKRHKTVACCVTQLFF